MTRVLSAAGRTAVWLVILGGVAAIVAVVLVPRLAGATPYSVLTGSMRPAYPPGTMVVVRPVAPADIRVGDVITYQRESGAARVVTHRVTEVGWNLRGEQTFRTKGDANGVVDAEPVRPVQVKGRVWYAVPHLGRVDLATRDERRLALPVAVAALLGYAAFMLTGAVRERRKRGTDDDREEVAA